MIRKSRRKNKEGEAASDEEASSYCSSQCLRQWFRWMFSILLVVCSVDVSYRYVKEAGLLQRLDVILSAVGEERRDLNKNHTTTTRVSLQVVDEESAEEPTTTGTTKLNSHYDVCILGGCVGAAVLAEQYASQLGKTVLVIRNDEPTTKQISEGASQTAASSLLLRTDSYRVWQYVQQFTDWENEEKEEADGNNNANDKNKNVVFRAKPVDLNWVDQIMYKQQHQQKLVDVRTTDNVQLKDVNCGKNFYSTGDQNSTITNNNNNNNNNNNIPLGTEIPSVDPTTNNIGETIKSTLELFDQNAPKVIVQQWIWAHSGGPEALVQLVMAFHSWMPTRTYMTLHKAFKPSSRQKDLPHWLQWYPELSHIPEMESINQLQAGDILILPCEERCPAHYVARGIKVYIWYLGYRNPNRVKDDINKGCGYISHNYFLTHGHDGVSRIPASHILLPYMNPQKNGIVRNYTRTIEREDLVIVNVHDAYGNEVKAIEEYCASRTTPGPCTVQKIKGFTMEGLIELYQRAKIVVGFCLNGSERCPIEAVLGGAVMVSNPCLTALDHRDFPIPKENLISGSNPPAKVIARILDNFDEESRRMQAMRQMYSSYGPLSLQQQTKEFIFAMDKVKVTVT